MNYTHKQAVRNYKTLKIYESKYDNCVDKKSFYFIRLDGVKMTKSYLRNDKKAFLYTFRKMIELFMQENPDFKVCYSYADEVSIYIPDLILKKYEYRIEKIISIFSSKITAAFYIAANEIGLELKTLLCSFDARLISLPDFNTVIKYIEARQMFNITRHLLLLNNQYLKDNTLVTSNDIIIALEKKGFIYEKVNRHERYGLLWVDDRFIKCFEFKENEKYLIELLQNHIYKMEVKNV